MMKKERIRILCFSCFILVLFLSLAGALSLRGIRVVGGDDWFDARRWKIRLFQLIFYLVEALLLWRAECAGRKGKSRARYVIGGILLFFLSHTLIRTPTMTGFSRTLIYTFWPVILCVLAGWIKGYLSTPGGKHYRTLRNAGFPVYLLAEGFLLFLADYLLPAFYGWHFQNFADEFLLLVTGGAVWMLSEEPEPADDMMAILGHDALLIFFMAGNPRMTDIFTTGGLGRRYTGRALSTLEAISLQVNERLRMMAGFWGGRPDLLGEDELYRIVMNCPLARFYFRFGAAAFLPALCAMAAVPVLCFWLIRTVNPDNAPERLLRAAALGLFLRFLGGLGLSFLLVGSVSAACMPGDNYGDFLLLAAMGGFALRIKETRAAGASCREREEGGIMKTGAARPERKRLSWQDR